MLNKKFNGCLILVLCIMLWACAPSAQAALEAEEVSSALPAEIENNHSELPEPQITKQVAVQVEPTTAEILPEAIDPLPQTQNTPVSPLTASANENRAVLINETVPDGTIVQKSQTFNKSWTLKNVGTIPWTDGYYLEIEANQSSNQIKAAEKIFLNKGVQPGETIMLSQNFTAADADGVYTVSYRLLSPDGAEVQIGQGNNLWLKIGIGEQAPISYSNELDPSGISFRLGRMSYSGSGATIQIFSSFSTVDYRILPAPSLLVDGKQVAFLGGSDDWQSGGYHSYLWHYSLTEDQAKRANSIVMVFDGSIRRNLLAVETVRACNTALSSLKASYPDINFGCNPPPGGYPFDSLKAPSGMTREKAHPLVLDTIEGAVYGRWEVKIK